MKPTIFTLLLAFLFSSNLFAQLNPVLFMSSNKATVVAGESFVVSVKVKDFKQILSMQYSTWYDDTKFKLDTVIFTGIVGNQKQELNVTVNPFRLSWIDFTLNGKTLADSTGIYNVHFTALKNAAVQGICFADDPFTLPFEISSLDPSAVWGIVQGSFLGLGCGFAWTKAANGTIVITDAKEAENLSIKGIKAYPNPSSERLNLEVEATENETVFIRVFDMQGKKIQEIEKNMLVGKQHIELNINDLANGNYLYQLATPKGTLMGKFTKE